MSQIKEIDNDMEVNKYKDLICSYVNRLLENNIVIKPKKIDEINFDLKFLFTKPEWFLELDDDLQYNIEHNIKLYFKQNYDTIKSQALAIESNEPIKNIYNF